MNKTKIEWVKNPNGSQGYTWNPITGCLNGCEYCYARKLANGRLKSRYLANKNVAPYKSERDYMDNRHNSFYPRFWEDRLKQLDRYAQLGAGADGIPRSWYNIKPKGIFVCDMSDLFGIGIPEEWTRRVLDTIKLRPEHRFYLLTKQPQNLIKFLGGNITNTPKGYRKPTPLPDNVWAGVSVTNKSQAYGARDFLQEVPATVKFLSFEPLLERMDGWALGNVVRLADLVIIGSQTGSLNDLVAKKAKDQPKDLTLMRYGSKWTLQPKIEWVEEIVTACDKAGVKVFLKDNLKPLLQQNKHNIYSSPEWAGKQFAVTGDHSLASVNPHPNEPMRKLRQELPV